MDIHVAGAVTETLKSKPCTEALKRDQLVQCPCTGKIKVESQIMGKQGLGRARSAEPQLLPQTLVPAY